MQIRNLGNENLPFFRQVIPESVKLALCIGISVLLMVSDFRWGFIQPIRSVVATVIYPLHLLVLAPIGLIRKSHDYLVRNDQSLRQAASAKEQTLAQSAKALQVDHLLLENQRLRALLELRARHGLKARGAQVIYTAADPFSRKLILDQGALHGIRAGLPVMDEYGIVGQITRVYPLTAELTLLTDPNHATPIQSSRNGLRGVVYGTDADRLELRHLATNADVKENDLLTTSGIDGVFPPGIPVARVIAVERQSESIFARIVCQPLALTQGVGHVLVISPTGDTTSERPPTEGENEYLGQTKGRK